MEASAADCDSRHIKPTAQLRLAQCFPNERRRDMYDFDDIFMWQMHLLVDHFCECFGTKTDAEVLVAQDFSIIEVQHIVPRDDPF